MTMLSDLIATELTNAARETLARFENDETGRAVREQLAQDVEQIMLHADPNEAGARLRYGWTWNDSARKGRTARSLQVIVHVLSPTDPSDSFPLLRARVRDLCTPDGQPVDTAETLEWLRATYCLGEVPDDLSELDTTDPEPRPAKWWLDDGDQGDGDHA